MKILLSICGLLCLLGCQSATLAAAQGHAVIAGAVKVQPGGRVYLVKNPLFRLPGAPLDSSSVDDSGRFSFSIIPDSTAEYGLVYTGNLWVRNLGIADGDSIYIAIVLPVDYPVVAFDKLGANTYFASTEWRDSAFESHLNADNYDAFRAYAPQYESYFAKRRDTLAMRYPNEKYLCTMMEGFTKTAIIRGVGEYLRQRSWDGDGKLIDSNRAHFAILDSTSLYSFSTRIPPDDLGIAELVYMVKYRAWRAFSSDTASTDRIAKHFEIAMGLPDNLRDIAVCVAQFWITLQFSRSEALEHCQAILPAYEKICKDKRCLALFKASLDKLEHLQAGSDAPDFEYPDVKGKPHRLSDFRGKYVYLDFWATWCGPCRQEQPDMAKIEEKYAKNPDIAFISVALENDDDKMWKKYQAEHHLPGVQVVAIGNVSSPVGKDYGIGAVPTHVLIDKQGKLISIQVGRIDPEATEKDIREALSRQ